MLAYLPEVRGGDAGEVEAIRPDGVEQEHYRDP